MNVPQVVAKIMDSWTFTNWVEAAKVASSLPEDVSEFVAAKGGFVSFCKASPNFFLVKKDNGVAFVNLSPLSDHIKKQKKFKELQREESRKLKEESGGNTFTARGRGGGGGFQDRNAPRGGFGGGGRGNFNSRGSFGGGGGRSRGRY